MNINSLWHEFLISKRVKHDPNSSLLAESIKIDLTDINFTESFLKYIFTKFMPIKDITLSGITVNNGNTEFNISIDNDKKTIDFMVCTNSNIRDVTEENKMINFITAQLRNYKCTVYSYFGGDNVL